MNIYKICIIGNGLAGLSTASILSQKNITIDLYAGSYKKNKSKNDNRTTAISESSYQFIKKKLHIRKNNIFWPCNEINLFFEDKGNIKKFLEFKEKKNLMYIFQNKELKKELKKLIIKNKNIKLIKKNISDIDYLNGSISLNKSKFSYDLIILCVGNNSKLYNKIAQGRSIEKNYKELALTTIVKHNSKINKVSQFFLKEGPLAILPFSKKMFSVVWSVKASYFKEKNTIINNTLGSRIKNLLNNPKIINTERIQSFPINLNLKTKYFKNNVLILGDGLHSIHPMAGQGFNLVLRDIKKLYELMSRSLRLGLAIKNSFLLKNFYQARKPENTILGLGVNFTNMFFKDNKYFSTIRKKILNNIGNFKFIRKISQIISDKGIST